MLYVRSGSSSIAAVTNAGGSAMQDLPPRVHSNLRTKRVSYFDDVIIFVVNHVPFYRIDNTKAHLEDLPSGQDVSWSWYALSHDKRTFPWGFVCSAQNVETNFSRPRCHATTSVSGFVFTSFQGEKQVQMVCVCVLCFV